MLKVICCSNNRTAPLKSIAVQTIDWSAAVVIQAASDVNVMIQNELQKQFATRNFNEYTDDEDYDDDLDDRN